MSPAPSTPRAARLELTRSALVPSDRADRAGELPLAPPPTPPSTISRSVLGDYPGGLSCSKSVARYRPGARSRTRAMNTPAAARRRTRRVAALISSAVRAYSWSWFATCPVRGGGKLRTSAEEPVVRSRLGRETEVPSISPAGSLRRVILLDHPASRRACCGYSHTTSTEGYYELIPVCRSVLQD